MFLFHTGYGLGDNFVLPTFCKMHPEAEVVFCLGRKYLDDFTKIRFLVDGKPIKCKYFAFDAELGRYYRYIKRDGGINILHEGNKGRTSYDIEIPPQNVHLPKRYYILHRNSHLQFDWYLNTGRYIFNHVWEHILKREDLLNALHPIYNIGEAFKNNKILDVSVNFLTMIHMIKECTGLFGVASGPSVLANCLGKKQALSWLDHSLLNSPQRDNCYFYRQFFYYNKPVPAFFHPQSQKCEAIGNIIASHFMGKLMI